MYRKKPNKGREPHCRGKSLEKLESKRCFSVSSSEFGKSRNPCQTLSICMTCDQNARFCDESNLTFKKRVRKMQPITKYLFSSFSVSLIAAAFCHFSLRLSWQSVIAYVLGTAATSVGVVLSRMSEVRTSSAKRPSPKARFRPHRGRLVRVAPPSA